MIGNDHWTIELAKLGMQEAGDELARRALGCRPPYAICVQGKWGSGKTSLMRYAMARLGGEPLAAALATEREPLGELPEDVRAVWKNLVGKSTPFIRAEFRGQVHEDDHAKLKPLVVPIWFNPWQHQRTELPAVGLLHEIRAQFTALLKAFDKAKKLSRNAVEAAFPLLIDLGAAIEELKGVPGLGGPIKSATQRFLDSKASAERRDFDTAHDAQRLNLLFEKAVRRLLNIPDQMILPAGLKPGHIVVPRRIVVFIDDLDRCSEEQTVHLLEAIKLYFQTSYCVFVVGVDGAAARRAVGKVLGQGAEVGREYLEKLFQATLHVPLPVGGAKFVQDLLLYNRLDGSRTGLEPEELAKLLLELVEPNPRKLKTFVSGLAAGWSLDGGATGDFKAYLLLAYLRVVHPDVYRLLAYDPSQAARLHAVIEGVLDPKASPVDYFLHGALRHAFSEMGTDDMQTRALVVTELIDRLDHLKGDQAFLRLLKDWASKLGKNEVVEKLRPLLQREEQ